MLTRHELKVGKCNQTPLDKFHQGSTFSSSVEFEKLEIQHLQFDEKRVTMRKVHNFKLHILHHSVQNIDRRLRRSIAI